jgi:gliding-associated putative ABC transporter substrate-binding component GldG
MKTKKTQALLKIILLLGILILVNFISVRLFARLDLTRTHMYTLSDASKNLVRNLDDRVTIKAYFSEELPSPYNAARRQVLDILNEYKAYAKGNIRFEFINPEGEKTEREAQEAGIPPVQVQVVKEDKFEAKRAFMGLAFQYEDRKEVLPVVRNPGSLEYDISSAVKRLITKTKKQVGFTTGHQEAEFASYQNAVQELGKQYDLVPVDLSSDTSAVPGNLAALLIIAPQKKFSDSVKYQIDRYIMQGGKAAFLLNAMNASLGDPRQARGPVAFPVETGLEDMLQSYGVRVNSDVVRDAQCAPITVMQQEGGYQMQNQVAFPYMPNVTNVDKTNPMVKDLQGLIFYFVSSVDTVHTANECVSEILLRSSSQSGRQTGVIPIDPFQRYTKKEFPESSIPLAVAVHGSFRSFFEGKLPAPQNVKSRETEIIVVGDGDFMKDDFARNRVNQTFFANIVDYLADDAGLMTIRSKEAALLPLDPVSDGTKQSLKYIDLFAPPLMIIAYGIFRWRKRAAFKKLFAAQA